MNNGKLSILVVEDEEAVRFLAQTVLEDSGYRVLTASNASEALEVIATGAPLSVIFSDISMPGGLDGCELIWELRRRGIQTPAVLTSGRWVEDKVLPPLTSFIPKPYRLGDVKRHMAAAV